MKYEIKHNTQVLTDREYKNFKTGDSVFGERDDRAETISTFSEFKDAEETLKKYHCSYVQNGDLWEIEEYAILEDCEGCMNLYLANV